MGGPAAAGAQAPGDRVRVHLLGLRVVDDTVVRLSEDSLIVRHGPAVPRSQIISLDVWRPRSFWRSWMQYGGTATGVASFADHALQSRQSSPANNTMVATLAIGAGVGLGAALVERLLHRGEWTAVGYDGRPGTP